MMLPHPTSVTVHPVCRRWNFRSILALLFSIQLACVAFAAETTKSSFIFNVPAGDAIETIKQVAQQAGIEIMFPAEVVRGVQTNAVQGEFTPREAIDRLLSGTVLYVVTDEKTGAMSVRRVAPADNPKVRLSAADTKVRTRADRQEDELVVLSVFEVKETRATGYQATNTTSATRLNTPIVDLPKNISVITRDLLDDLKVTEFNDALYLSASVSTTSPYSGRVAVRGLENAAPKRNGLGNYGSDESITDTVTMDRIEVVKGPSSLLYGSSSAGGLINYITKKPTNYPIDTVRFMFGANKKIRTELDFGGPMSILDDRGAQLTYRLVAANETTDGPGLYNLSQRGVAALSVRWQISPKTYVMVGGEYVQSHRTDSRIGADTIHLAKFGPSGVYDSDFQFNQGLLLTRFQRDEGVAAGSGPLNHHDTAVTRYDVDIAHSFSENLNFILNYNWMQNKLVEIGMGSGHEGWVDARAPGMTSPTYNEMLMPAGFRWPNRIQNSVTAVLNYNFKRDWIDLQVVAGIEYYAFDLQMAYYTLNPPGWQKVNYVTLAGYDKLSFANTPKKILADVLANHSTMWQQEFYYTRKQTVKSPYLLFNSSFFDNQLRLIAGIRRDDITINQMFFPSARTYASPLALGAGQLTASPASATTPLLGVSVTPFKNQRGFTIYSSYSRSLLANEIVNPDGTTLPAVKGEGLEVGIKFDLAKRLSATLSWFDIKSENLPRGILNSNPYRWEATGEQASKGVDFDLFYAITPDWQLLASGAILDATYVTDSDPHNVGTQLPSVPKWSYSLWNKYTFPSGSSLRGFSMGGGAVWKPAVLPFGVSAPLLINPAYNRFDLLFGYNTKIGKNDWEFSVKINNITDKLYMDGQNGWGPARGYEASVMVRF